MESHVRIYQCANLRIHLINRTEEFAHPHIGKFAHQSLLLHHFHISSIRILLAGIF
jgi:hypothetical protein